MKDAINFIILLKMTFPKILNDFIGVPFKYWWKFPVILWIFHASMHKGIAQMLTISDPMEKLIFERQCRDGAYEKMSKFMFGEK